MKLENNNFWLTVLCVSVLYLFAQLCIENMLYSPLKIKVFSKFIFWAKKNQIRKFFGPKILVCLVLNLFMADPILLADTPTLTLHSTTQGRTSLPTAFVVGPLVLPREKYPCNTIKVQRCMPIKALESQVRK